MHTLSYFQTYFLSIFNKIRVIFGTSSNFSIFIISLYRKKYQKNLYFCLINRRFFKNSSDCRKTTKLGMLFSISLFYTNYTNYFRNNFNDVRKKQEMYWMKYRGLEKVATCTMLMFATMNLKKLAAWLWKAKKP